MNIKDTVKSAVLGMPVMLTGGQPGYRAGEQKLAWNHFDAAAALPISMRSEAFEDGGTIPAKHSAEAQNISPPLAWSDLPEGTLSVALIVEDPDAPTPEPFVHWLLYNIAPSVTSLGQSSGGDAHLASAGGAMQGKNSNLKLGWTGMAPPKGDTPHRYFFQLFALDTMLPLKGGEGRTALFSAMAGHVIGRGQIIGTFQR